MNMQKERRAVFAPLLLTYVFLLILSVGIVYGLVALYHVFPHQPIPGAFSSAKPCENFVFMSACIIVPVIASLLTVSLARGMDTIISPVTQRIMPVLVVGLTILSGYVLVVSNFIWIITHNGHHFIGEFVISAVVLWLIWNVPLKWPRGLCFMLLSILFVMLSFAFRIYDIQMISASWAWLYSIGPELYVMSQTLAGQTLLVDLPSQYGYFPVFLAPILHVLGLHSLFAVTLMFFVLAGIAFGALFYVLHKQVHYTSLFLTCCLAILFLNTEAYSYMFGGQDPYYQYMPLRCFWPFLSVLAFYAYAQKSSLGRSSLISLLSGIALIWNQDTGVAVAGAFMGFLLLKGLFVLTEKDELWSMRKIKLWELSLKLCTHICIIVGCIAAFLYLTQLKAGEPIRYDWLFFYQHLFYVLGFAMMPLPRTPNPWMLVMAVYLFGIMFSQFYWHKDKKDQRFLDLMLYLSLLGVGVFTYYSGRAHVLNFMKIIWPALIIATLLADRLFCLIKTRQLSRGYALATLPLWFVTLICSVAFVSLIPSFARDDHLFLKHFQTTQDPQIKSEIDFINANKGTHKACLILALRGSIDYLETGLASPVKWPGLQFPILDPDRDAFMTQILEHPVQCIFYGVGVTGSIEPTFDVKLSQFLTVYRVAAQNQQGSLLLLVPKKSP